MRYGARAKRWAPGAGTRRRWRPPARHLRGKIMARALHNGARPQRWGRRYGGVGSASTRFRSSHTHVHRGHPPKIAGDARGKLKQVDWTRLSMTTRFVKLLPSDGGEKLVRCG